MRSLTGSSRFSPAGGDTASACRNVSTGSCHTHRGHTAGHLSRSRQPQQGDVIVEVLAVVVRVGDGLEMMQTQTVLRT